MYVLLLRILCLFIFWSFSAEWVALSTILLQLTAVLEEILKGLFCTVAEPGGVGLLQRQRMMLLTWW
jgi:hypothetical protein